jgi:hypothetical protein
MVYDGEKDQLSANTREGSRLMFDKMDLIKANDIVQTNGMKGES